MNIVGYADRISVAPGETVRFMVSCQMRTYQAHIVRLRHGDTNPTGPSFKEELLETPVSGEYQGRRQNLVRGSYIIVPDHPLLRQPGSFTLQSWIFATNPHKGMQGILTKGSPVDGPGYGLVIEDGSLSFLLGGSDGRNQRFSTGIPLRPAAWHFSAVVYDEQNSSVTLYQQPLSMWLNEDSSVRVERMAGVSSSGANESPFVIAASWSHDAGKGAVSNYFNGKIDRPRLFSRALTDAEIQVLRYTESPSQFSDSLVAAWDFGRDFSSAIVTDISGNALHGRTVNMPARAVTGHNWTGDEPAYRRVPEQYAAIHFHDDDLEDAGWDVDFKLTVPPDMQSGIYAARLRTHDAEDHVPFIVRHSPGGASAPVLFLAPTLSYLAYGNYHLEAISENRTNLEKLAGHKLDFEYPILPPDRYMVENNLLSLYEKHSDGSGVFYVSHLCPLMAMRPKYRHPALGLGQSGPHQLGADLHLLHWMDSMGFAFDVASDQDLHFEGDQLLRRYRVVVTGTHPEYWTAGMLDALEAYLAKGGRIMYLGGNGFYWVTSFDPERPHIVELRRWGGSQSWDAAPGEYYHSTTGELGGLWRNRGRAPQKIIGVGFTAQGFDACLPYRRLPDSFDPRAAFIFDGVGGDEEIGSFGLVMGGAAGYEIDRADPGLGTPPHALVLATATGFSDVYQHAVEEVSVMDRVQGGSVNPLVRADMVYFEGPRGGAVFSVGSIAWCGGLAHNNYDNNVSRITRNVLSRFASDDDPPWDAS